MKVGDLRPVDVPVIRCSECQAAYTLELPVFQWGRDEPEWIYRPGCKHKKAEPVADDEYARLAVARIRGARS